jgi:hypothetical protein
MMVLADVEVKPRVRNTHTFAHIFQLQTVESNFIVKLVFPHLVKYFSAVGAVQSFVTVFTIAFHLSLS